MGFFGKLKEKIFGKTNKQSEKYVAALGKSRSNFADKLNALAARYRSIDEDYFDELEEILIEADIGVKIVMEIIEETKKEVRLSKIDNPKEINERGGCILCIRHNWNIHMVSIEKCKEGSMRQILFFSLLQ